MDINSICVIILHIHVSNQCAVHLKYAEFTCELHLNATEKKSLVGVFFCVKCEIEKCCLQSCPTLWDLKEYS